MKRNVAVATVFLALILSISLVVVAQSNTIYAPFQNPLDRSQQFTLAAPIVIGINAQQHAQLNQSTRADIYAYVQSNPGIHFRGICDNLGLSIGRAQYHTGILVSAGLLTVFSDGKIKRFFVTGKFSARKMRLISLLRHVTRRDILKIITERKSVSHGELADQLDITSQGLTWQMHHLRKEGVIQQTSNGLKLTYSLNQTDAVLVRESIGLLN